MKGPDRRRRETVGPLPVAEHVTWKPGARDTPNVCIRDMGLFVYEPPQPMAAYLRLDSVRPQKRMRHLVSVPALHSSLLPVWMAGFLPEGLGGGPYRGRFLSARDTYRTNTDPMSSSLLLSTFPHLFFMRAPDPYTQHSAGGVALKSKSSICNVT